MDFETILLGKLTLMIYLLIFSAISVSSKTYSRVFGPFDSTEYNILSFQPSATISGGFVQITPDTFNDTLNVRNKSGRVLLPKPFKLWDEHSQRVASFSSSFVININQMAENGRGEGFAFVIAPDLNIPFGSYGQYLGLTNSTTDGNATNHLVAIELDTVKQDFDPDDSHIGINLNSIRSFSTVFWPALRVSKNSSNFHNVKVEYNSQDKLLNVYMIGDRSPFVPVLSVPLKLEDYVNQYSYFGFAASTGNFIQLNCLMKWELEVDILPDLEKHLLVKILLPGLALLAVCLAGLWYYFHRKKRFLVEYDPNMLRKALESLPWTAREFGFKDLKKATNNFDEKLKLGQGGFGVVYKGVLLKDKSEVAVKKFSRENIKGKDDFLAELTIINRLRHKNLVRLVGWCHKNGTLLLVYEYMPNGSLDQHLFVGPEKRLSWENRYNIISGVASALQYLHNDYDQKVLHRDLKASNIMLDSDLNPKLGDFGLARALDNDKTSYAELQGVPGTMGYIAPECILTGKATRESDVFGFGAVILEVVCGKRPYVQIAGFQFLADWVWKLYREGRILEAIDERVGTDYVVEEAERLLLLGLACSHPIANERPKTGMIIQIISGSVPVPYVPPFRPTIVWTTNEDGTTTNTTDFSLTTNTLTSSCYNGETDIVQVQIEPATTSTS